MAPYSVYLLYIVHCLVVVFDRTRHITCTLSSMHAYYVCMCFRFLPKDNVCSYGVTKLYSTTLFLNNGS